MPASSKAFLPETRTPSSCEILHLADQPGELGALAGAQDVDRLGGEILCAVALVRIRAPPPSVTRQHIKRRNG